MLDDFITTWTMAMGSELLRLLCGCCNVKETRWLIIAAYITLGMVLGLALGYLPVRSDLNALVRHVDQIDSYLASQQPQPASAPLPVPPQQDKKHGQR